MVVKLDETAFVRALGESLRPRLGSLLDLRLTLIDQEIADGTWRSYNSRERWFKENIPVPLINESGRHFEILHMQHQQLFPRGFFDAYWSTPDSDAYMRFLEQGENGDTRFTEYRNFLCVGRLDVETWGFGYAVAFDKIANRVITQLFEKQHRNYHFEILQNIREAISIELTRGTHTPEPIYLEEDAPTPVRDTTLRLEQDVNYWRAVYHVKKSFPVDFEPLANPELFIESVARAGPEFSYSKTLSKRTRLVFATEAFQDSLAWALVYEKKGSPFFDIRPALSLVDLTDKRSLDPTRRLDFPHFTSYGVDTATCARSVEVDLLYRLPRYRRFMEFYHEPIQEAANK